MRKVLTALLTVASFLGVATGAVPPSVVSYQGRISIGDSPYTGAGRFKFAIVDAGTNTSRQATAVAIRNGQSVSGVQVTDSGTGYITPPAVTFSGGGGSGARATAYIFGSAVTGVAVDNGGTGYTSNPTVTIAPPPIRIAYNTFWSNDGTSSYGNEPAGHVVLPVQNGLFNAPLGNTNLLNMAPLPPQALNNQSLHLRIWFSEGANGFSLLAPDQPLASAPYALLAGSLIGMIPDSQLPPNIARLNQNQTFTGQITFSNLTAAGMFYGNGAGLSNINLETLSSGAISAGALGLGLKMSILSQPYVLSTGDVNDDGRLDLLISTRSVGNHLLSIVTNNAAGGFVLCTNLPQLEVAAVVCADVTGDGRTDLVATSSGFSDQPDWVTVWTNNAQGGFGLSTNVPTGQTPTSLTVSDFNGDGKLDIITANQHQPGLTILTNGGAGRFGQRANPSTPSYPLNIVSADVNGDAWKDLVFIGDQLITVWTNNKSGMFAPAPAPPVPLGVREVDVADVNDDGFADLIASHNNTTLLTVLTNTRAGTFAVASRFGVGSVYALSIGIGTLNGDARPDFVFRTEFGLHVFTNAGKGHFALASTAACPLRPGTMEIADFNNDGRSDAAVLDNASYELSLYYNQMRLSGVITSSSSTNSGDAFIGGKLWFGDATGQMINLWKTNYAVGVQSGVLYSRTADGYAWFKHGSHADGSYDPGNGGSVLMALNAAQLHVTGNILANGTITPNSDRNAKTNISSVDTAAVLERLASLPIQQWRFKEEGEDVKHIGPMAQDFHAAFGLGAVSNAIATVDADGIALAAIQALNRKLEDEAGHREREIRELKELLKSVSSQLQHAR